MDHLLTLDSKHKRSRGEEDWGRNEKIEGVREERKEIRKARIPRWCCTELNQKFHWTQVLSLRRQALYPYATTTALKGSKLSWNVPWLILASDLSFSSSSTLICWCSLMVSCSAPTCSLYFIILAISLCLTDSSSSTSARQASSSEVSLRWWALASS